MEQIDACDPPLSAVTLVKGGLFDICGLRCTDEIKIPFDLHQKMCQRFTLLTPAKNFFIVEIWHNCKFTEVEFNGDWEEEFEFVVIRDIRYHGETFINGKKAYLFRMGQKDTSKRFIWVSAPGFWKKPTHFQPIKMYDLAYFPDQHKKFTTGILRSARGAQITSYWTKFPTAWQLHTETNFGPYSFEDILKTHYTLEATVKKFNFGACRKLRRSTSILFNE